MRLITSLRLAAIISLAGMPVAATPIIGVTGTGGASVIYEGAVTFPDFADFVGDATIVSKDHISTELILDVAYDAADYDLPNAFRWGERITNSSGVAWTDYHIDITGGTFLFQASPTSAVPEFAAIGSLAGGPPITIELVDGTVADIAGAKEMTNVDGSRVLLSASATSVWFFFANPVLPTESFDIWIPVGGLNSSSSGTFQLTQSFSSVPEPSTGVLTLLGALLFGGVAKRWRRRSGQKTN